MQDLLVQALKTKISLDFAEVDKDLLKELKGMIKKEEFLIIKSELEELLEE